MKTAPIIDTTGFPKELILLLKILGSHSLDESHFVDVDWNKFLDLAFHHRVYPILYVRLKEYTNTSIPHTVIKALHSKYSTNVINMLRLSSELEKINKEFLDLNIQSLLLKGPVLALKLYGDLSLRTSKDLDILVSPHHVTQAEEILVRLGYETEEKDQDAINIRKRKQYHISYVHPLRLTQVELHWHMSLELPGPSFEDLWERRITATVSSSPINYLGNEDLLVYLVSHGSKHGWFRLRWLYDIDQMMSKDMINIEKLKQIYKSDGGQHLAGQSLLLTSKLFSTRLPNQLEILTHNKRSQKLAYSALFFIKNKVDLSPDGDKHILGLHKHYLYSLMTWKQKLSQIIVYLYPSPKDVLLLPLPKSLHFLYFPLRPFLWLWRSLRKESESEGKLFKLGR
ncbi:nucleotidyltransferase family protein [Paenibacillus polygoni]|uniref:Nucleotidyltransferase family protein n=1 Tax=Paenibacillus polygoni TaxID=3050112 RepID=A0ABY8X2M2_9BACL|nr:nucleotidyltransferase family protein [Paenibacillus polygoni]WIV19414.1 nucleotidyltransferase family protein [Paenibacillus polygoni]